MYAFSTNLISQLGKLMSLLCRWKYNIYSRHFISILLAIFTLSMFATMEIEIPKQNLFGMKEGQYCDGSFVE